MNRVAARPAVLPHAPSRVDPALGGAVARLLNAGGKGLWFTSVSPFGDGKPQRFFLVSQFPPKADPKSPMLMLRTESTRAYLAGLAGQGVPFILGTIPEQSEVGAAALGREIPLAGAALKAGGITAHSSAVLLQPSADKLVVAHETQHWRDFENPRLEASFNADMKPFFAAKYLSGDDKAMLTRLMWELRGHNAQALTARADAAKGVPFLNGAGRVETGQEARESLKFQQGYAASIFHQAYDSSIFQILAKVKKADPGRLKTLAAIFTKYDLSRQPGAPLSFAKFAGA
jgi:hypothetical protein